MKFLFSLLIVIATSVCCIAQPNLVGKSRAEIISKLKNDETLKPFQVGAAADYGKNLSYIDADKTVIQFIMHNDICTHYQIIMNISKLNGMLTDMNEIYIRNTDTTWTSKDLKTRAKIKILPDRSGFFLTFENN